MSPVNYDAFGEVTTGDPRSGRLERGMAPKGSVQRVGIALFWLIAAFVITARVFFFQPDVYASFHDHSEVATVDTAR